MNEIQNSPPLKVIKPVYLTWVVFLHYLPLQINLAFVGGAVGGGIGFLLMLFFGWQFPFWYPFAFFILLFFIGTPLIIMFVGKRTYNKTEYKFYADHLEYSEGFWTVEYKTIKYQHITQVYLRKSMAQRLFKVGTIYLSVPSWGSNSGIAIADIKEPEKVYQEVQAILAEY